MMNIEAKARYSDLKEAKEIAQQLGAQYKWRRQQIDTYFHAANGRLKLRESEGMPAELIGYTRSDESQVRPSYYEIYGTENGAILKQILSETLGVAVQVRKIRTLYLLDYIRIHLDDVEFLGTFLEFEAVISNADLITEATQRVNRLKDDFHISQEDICPYSYSDLQLKHNE